MANWMVAEKAARHIKEKNPQTMIGVTTLRKLTKNGFPCLKIDSRTLINVDSFEDDLVEYSKMQTRITTQKQNSPIRRVS